MIIFFKDTSQIHGKEVSKKEKLERRIVSDVHKKFTKQATESRTQKSTYAKPTIKVIKRHYYVELFLVLDNTVYEA